MFRVVLCCAILASFSVGGAADVRGECRAGVCDDRPACLQSPCRCIYPSRADCALFYQCVQGKPIQYRCSRGLLFNEDTLTCDYDFNVNCSIGKITRTSESSTGVMTTVAGVTTPEVPETTTEIGSDTTSDHPSRSLGTSTEASSNDASQKFSTEIYRTTASNEDSSTETFASESSDISAGTANTTLTGAQSESYSKSTGKDDTTIPDSSVKPKETSDFPTYSSSDTSIDTTYSKSSDFITEITSRAPTTKQSEVTETTKSTSTIKNEESTETASPVSMTEESAVPDTSEPIFTDREGEEQETTSPSTTKENVVSETISTSTAKEIKDTETTIFEAKKSEEPETTNPSSRTKEIEVSETTSSKSTAKVDKETETTSFRSTITTTSKTRQANGSSGVTEHSLSTEEMQPEVTTNIPGQNWTCPSRFGLFPDQSDCNKFYHCAHWKPYHKRCPSNLHFNPTLKVCDWPENAGCGSTISTTVTEQAMTTPSRQRTTDKGGNASFCGCDSCDLPVPDDCNSYVLCIDKSATLISCEGGLNFNVKTGTCDWKENVVCDTSHACPLPVGRFPYPHSCYHFMDCNNTVMTVNKCPEGTVYSKSEEKCSWTAVCDDTYTSTETTSSAKYEGTTVMEISTHISNSEETVKESSIEDTSTSYRDDTSSELNTFSTSRTMPTKRTDKTSGTSSTFHPLTTRTERNDFSSSFRTTYEETTIIENLSTDHTTVSDENDITTTLSPLTITESTQSSKSLEIATSESNITEKFTVIPNTASMPSESLPVSSNQDFISTHSTEFGSSSDLFSTDTDLTYSSMEASTMNPATELIIPTANASTSADTSSFEIDSTTINETTANSVDFTDASTKRLVTIILSSTEISKLPSTEDHSVISEVTETPTNTASPITEDYQKSTSPDVSNLTLSTTETSSNSSFVCPSRFGLFPDPDSCFRFYHCSHWVALHKWCPSDLHFSPELQVCDWPYRAGCDGSAVVPTSETAQPKGDDVVLNESCDCECCFYPNKTDCSRYVLCLDGVPHRGQCEEGLLFNHLDDNCDIAERVACLQKPFSCPAENGIFPHPALCAAFYECVDGRPFLQRCPEGEHFKASEGKCTDPCDANCDKTLSCNRPHPPPTCAESDGLLPAGGDCSSYYQCAEGHAYFVKCPDGSHFNAEYGVCEPPCDARCDPTIDCPLPVQHAKSKAPDFSSPSCTKPNGLFPAAEDCGAYYLCTKGRARLLRCPPGLHYSIKDETCEPPCNAQCDRNIDCTRPKSRKPKKRIIPSSHLPLRLLCKILNNGTLPNPKNCTSFYSCSEGEARLVPCPRGLHFDPEDKECKSPCLAGCDSSIKCPFEIPVPTGKCSCENCYLQDPADCSAYLFCSQGFLTKGYCPRWTLFDRSSSQCRNVSEVVCEAIGDPAMCRSPSGNFPHPGNCKKFIRCEDSVAHVTDCEEGLEFDLAIRACANPKGYCDPTGKDPLCEKATGQFAHPENSSLFYRCENGLKYLKSCSHPLIYNALDQVCDWPHNVQDNSIEETLKRQDTEDQITEYGSALSAFKKSSDLKNSAGLPCQVVPGVTCPCACRVTTYDDCDSFFHCRGDGKACRRRCPEGLFFNRKTLVCDLPQNVECRDFFFATLRRLQSPNVVKASLKYPFQALLLSRTSEFHP